MARWSRGRARGEDGQILILALAFLTLFGVAIAAILGLASSNFRATTKIRDQRRSAYAVDSAMDGAIQFVRVDKTRGAAGGECPDFQVTINGVTANVTCERTGTVLDLDREIEFEATGGGSTIEATVIFRDSSAGSGTPDVDVRRWRYRR